MDNIEDGIREICENEINKIADKVGVLLPVSKTHKLCEVILFADTKTHSAIDDLFESFTGKIYMEVIFYDVDYLNSSTLKVNIDDIMTITGSEMGTIEQIKQLISRTKKLKKILKY